MKDLIQAIRDFDQARDWDKYHSPKNLAMALSVEVAEIVEIFRWLTEEDSQILKSDTWIQANHEIGDVMICLLNLADRLGIDPVDAAWEKLKQNSEKYPAEKVKGKALKYSEY